MKILILSPFTLFLLSRICEQCSGNSLVKYSTITEFICLSCRTVLQYSAQSCSLWASDTVTVKYLHDGHKIKC